MKRILLITLVCALVAATPASANTHWVFADGDSLAVGTAPYLPGALPGWRFRTSAAVSRHAADGARILRRRPHLARYIAVSLGTNDDPRFTAGFRAAIQDVMAVAGKRRCVVWANIVRPPVAGASYAGYNRVLRQERDKRSNLKIVNWKAMVARHPEWLAADGVHVNAAGYRARARGYARALRRCPAT